MSHEEFSRLVDLWHEDIRFSSSVDEIERSRYYVQILKGGGEVVPFIIEELKKEPDFWFSALEMITGANPVPEDAEGDLYAMSEYWIEWFEHGENDRERSA